MTSPDADDRFTRSVQQEARRARGFRRLLHRLLRILPGPLRRLIDRERPDPIPGILAEFARTHEDVRFVQIGACDGITGDPIHDYIVARGWRGVAVEPVPANFAKLQETYRGHDNVTCLEVAISDHEGEQIFYHLRRTDESLPVWYDQIGSFRKEHILKHAILHPDVEKHLIETPIPCLTLLQLVARSGLDRVDLLHTDAEGFDYEILKQVDFDRIHPRIILYEDLHLSPSDRRAATELLQGHGYTLISGGMDTLALRPEPAEVIR